MLFSVGELHHKHAKEDELGLAKRKSEADPSVFNFYIYLRTHPLIARHQIATRKAAAASASSSAAPTATSGGSAALQLSGFRSASLDKDSTSFSEDTVTPLERRLYFSTAHFHLRGGCPALALEVLSKLPNKVHTCLTSIEVMCYV